MKKEKTITIVQYDNCIDCSYCEFPDKKGEIICPGYKVRIREFVMNKTGEKIRNPIKARCEVDGKMLLHLSGCQRWFKGGKVIKL